MYGLYLDAQKVLSGAMIYVNRSGEIEAMRGLIKAEDQEKAIAQGLLEASKHQSGTTSAKPKPAYPPLE